MSKFAEDDRIEQLNDHKRRLKADTPMTAPRFACFCWGMSTCLPEVEQHKRETERLIEMRREMHPVMFGDGLGVRKAPAKTLIGLGSSCFRTPMGGHFDQVASRMVCMAGSRWRGPRSVTSRKR